MKLFLSAISTMTVFALVLSVQVSMANLTDPVPVMLKGNIQLKSLTSITFSKEGVLFLASV